MWLQSVVGTRYSGVVESLWVLGPTSLILVSICAACALVTYRSRPSRLVELYEELRSRVSECEATCGDVKASWTRTQAALDGLGEELESQLDRVETRRRRAQAQENRAKGAQGFGPPGAPGNGPLDAIQDPGERRRAAHARARAMGLPG